MQQPTVQDMDHPLGGQAMHTENALVIHMINLPALDEQ